MFANAVDITPEEFEAVTESFLRRLGTPLTNFATSRREHLSGLDGSYEIDITARFEALGATFVVLVECKHHKSPIKRDVVQVLRDRIASTGAHKGMLFSTARFQSGAVEYAQAHGIALVHVADGSTTYVARSYRPQPRRAGGVALWAVTLSESGAASYGNLAQYSREAALEALGWPTAPS